jgi:hypothetical protein
VSRAVKLMGCFGAVMLVFWWVRIVGMVGLYDGKVGWRFGCQSGKKRSGGGKSLSEVKVVASGQNNLHMHAEQSETKMTD